MTLRDTTNVLLRAPDVAQQLAMADNYIQAYNRLPSQFVLPADHGVLRPIIEAFATDTHAFSQYIRALRDAADGKAYDDLHDLYRTVSMRALQSERRRRIRRAVDILMQGIEVEIARPLNYEQQLQVARFVEHRWGEMRLEAMSAERRLLNAKRLSSEDRNIALERFWREIDKALDKGVVDLGAEAHNELLALFKQ